MADDLRALLIPPQEVRLRSRFGLNDIPLHLITSGWHRLVVAAPDRVFVFPRHQGDLPMLEREGDILSSLDLDFAPRLLGLHRDNGISPYPFLELTRIAGRSYDAVMGSLSFDDTVKSLEGLGRRVAQWQHATIPSRFASRPAHLDAPRVSDAWTQPDVVLRTAHLAAESLAPYLGVVPAGVWGEALIPLQRWSIRQRMAMCPMGSS